MRLKTILFLIVFLTIIYIGVFKEEQFITKIIHDNITNVFDESMSDFDSKPVVNQNIRDDLENIPYKDPAVYIYNTHQTESYSDAGYEQLGITPSVKDASFLLQKYLKDLEVDSLVEENDFMKILNNNNWQYEDLYKVSRIYIENTIKRYENIKLYIDLHRDSIKKNASTIKIGDKKYAKVLFVIGVSNNNYEKNLEIANKLNKIITKEYDISRGILKKTSANANGIYNQDLNENIVLIEIGGYQNSYEEVDNTLKLLASSIKEYLNEQS